MSGVDDGGVWGQFDFELVAAVDAYDQAVGPHGYPMWEALDPGLNPNEYASEWRVQVDEPVVDWVEKARRDAEAVYRKQHPNDTLNGLIFPARRVRRSTV